MKHKQIHIQLRDLLYWQLSGRLRGQISNPLGDQLRGQIYGVKLCIVSACLEGYSNE